MKKTWKERTKSEKILSISNLAVSLVILCASVMKLLNFWPKALNLAIPLFAVHYLIETVYYWKTDKDAAAFSLFAAVIVIAVSCAVFFL